MDQVGSALVKGSVNDHGTDKAQLPWPHSDCQHTDKTLAHSGHVLSLSSTCELLIFQNPNNGPSYGHVTPGCMWKPKGWAYTIFHRPLVPGMPHWQGTKGTSEWSQKQFQLRVYQPLLMSPLRPMASAYRLCS